MNESQQGRPLVLITNDDGIESPGLWSLAGAFAEFADLFVCAPREQQSGASRSMLSSSTGCLHPVDAVAHGLPPGSRAFAIEGTPAQAVQHGVYELADRPVALVASGINYGENVGSGVTISGTVGAALEGASFGIPSLAISQQTALHLQDTHSREVDFSAAADFARRFGAWLLGNAPPGDATVLKIDLPHSATAETPWRVTRVSRIRVYRPTPPQRASLDECVGMGYRYADDIHLAEPDSDTHALHVVHEVSVTPISLDLTARVALPALEDRLRQDLGEAG